MSVIKRTFLITTSSQTILDDTNAIPPGLSQPPLDSQLSQIIFSSQEVKTVAQNLHLGKASRPNWLSNGILHELANEISVPHRSSFNQSLKSGIVSTSFKESNVCSKPKKC